MQSLFTKFPTNRGPLKLLIYGEPGTMKTRRALQMPSPLYVIDMECGACDYGDLVNPEQDYYLRTKSHTDVSDALEELLAKPTEEVGTLVIDPISQIWQSIQNSHVQKQVQRKRKDPEDVYFDVGTWGRLKRTYGDIMAAILSAPFHVVMTARGKDQIDERGNILQYGYEGERSTIFLANVVIESRREGDIIIKDRTGTFKEKQKIHRVNFRRFLSEDFSAQPIDSDTKTALKDAQQLEKEARFHIEWKAGGGKERFLRHLRHLDISYEIVAAYCQQNKRPEPAIMPPQQRDRLIQFLNSEEQRQEVINSVQKKSA